MRFVVACLLLAACSSSSSTPVEPPKEPATPDAPQTIVSPFDPASSQLVTVVSDDWDAVPATLRRYEIGETWTQVGDPVPVVLGKTGLGWGRGLSTTPPPSDAPMKKEGDGRSPAGAFSLGSAFGYAPPSEAGFLKMPYLQATPDLECVDDPSSSHYNTLVYRSTIAKPDWSSSEIMKRPDALYRWGLFVNHNASSPPTPGGGSCIFLHLWSGADSATVGCTAGDESKMKTVLGWLDPAKHPILVQLPKSAYATLRATWALP
jgi:hypothetical protein